MGPRMFGARARTYIPSHPGSVAAVYDDIYCGSDRVYDYYCDMESTGYGIFAGAGLKYFLIPRLALDFRLTTAWGEQTEVKVENQATPVEGDGLIRGGLFHLGVAFHPTR